MGMMRLPPDFSEFLRLLNENDAEYLLVGGFAVNVHGYSRSTGDITVWVDPSAENAGRVAAALRDFGFPNATPALFTEPDQIVRMGVPPLRIEILTGIDGVEFDSCYQRRISVRTENIEMPVIRLEDLIANKKAAGRPKDLADLDELETLK